MIRTSAQFGRACLVAGLLIGSSLLGWSCSGKKEAKSETMSTTSDSSVFGRQGDTTNNSLNALEQAPPDSASASGAVVPAEVKVKPKN